MNFATALAKGPSSLLGIEVGVYNKLISVSFSSTGFLILIGDWALPFLHYPTQSDYNSQLKRGVSKLGDLGATT